MLLEGIIGELSDFRRALRGEDRASFDSLMNKAREHASSCTVVPTLDPMGKGKCRFQIPRTFRTNKKGGI